MTSSNASDPGSVCVPTTDIGSSDASHESPKSTIARLARLDLTEYEQVRINEAKTLGIRVSALDRDVSKARNSSVGNENNVGKAFNIEADVPWHRPVDGAELLDELAATFRRFVALPEHGDTIGALWSLHTYAFEYSHITPILAICSPEKGCGKTTMRDVLAGVVRAPLSTDGISASALFRVIEKWKPTLLMDDFDSWGKENNDLRSVLNTGYRRGGQIIRCVGDDSDPRGFATFTPKAINLIGRLHPTLHDRAIVITMRRKIRSEKVDSLYGFDGDLVRRKCARWVADNVQQIQSLKPGMPEGLFNRQADNWRPLLLLGEVAGGDWPGRAREAAISAIGANTDNESQGVMLLVDIRSVFNTDGVDRITTDGLLRALTNMDERPWGEYSQGRPITARQVARLLKPFGVNPGTIRMHGKGTAKGYYLDAFGDAFTRYLMDESVTTSQPCENRCLIDPASVTQQSAVTDMKHDSESEIESCDAVTDGVLYPKRIRL